MKKNLTEMVFILDKSGSMSGLESDTIGGFNSMLEKQKKEEGEALVTTVLFDTDYKTIHDRIDIGKVEKLTESDYMPGGCTALIDAIGKTVNHISDIHRYIREEDVPEKVIFVITTDGYENASRIYSSSEVKKMIEEKKALGWEFLFIGANIDSVETAKSFGIKEDRVANSINDKGGISAMYMSIDRACRSMRTNGAVSECWDEEVSKDYKKRK